MEYLSEHQAAQAEKPEGDNYEPTDQEKADIKLSDKLFGEAKKNKSKFDEKWPDYYKMYRGKQWKEQRPSYRHSEVINLIFREIQSSVPIVMDSRPKFEYLPMEPFDIEFAEIMNQVCEADWTRYNWLHQITECVYDAHIVGSALGGCYFDKKKELGLGAICLESEDPFYHFPDPSAKGMNRGGKYHIKAEPMSISDIKSKWPNGKYVKSDVVDISRMDVSDKDKISIRTPSETSVVADRTQQYDGSSIEEALVITLYLSPEFEIDEEEKQDTAEDGSVSTKYIQKAKYPKGRKIVVAGKVVLESVDGEYDDVKFPYANLQNYINQRQFWGISDVEQLESPQKTFNKLVSFSLDVLTLMGNPIWLVGTGSGVDTENLFNSPGLVVEADDITQVKRQEGVQLQPYVLQLVDRLKSWFDDVSGSSDVSRGVKPEGVSAMGAIQALQEATQTRIRQKSRNIDAFLQDMGQMYASRVLQYYTAPRVFRITNRDGSQKFFKFHVESQALPDGSTKKVARFRPYGTDEQGAMKEGDEKVVEVKGQLDVKVNTGTTLPFAKADEQNKSLQLFDRGIIDDEEVLKNFDYPNWQAVLQRVTQKKQEAAAMEAQAKAGGKPQM